MPDIAVLYASISSRTRRVALEIVKEFSPLHAEAFDLRDGLQGVGNCKLMLLGSPTYGVGEWHHLWEKSSLQFDQLDLNWSTQPVGIFALGDAKHHPETFARAIVHLHGIVTRLNAKLIGESDIDESYDRALCNPLLISGKFPGLVLDQVKQRRLSQVRIKNWVEQLKQELGLQQQPTARRSKFNSRVIS